MDYISYIIIVDELARVDASHSITCSAHTTLGTSPIVQFGNDEQKQRYVPLLASGTVLGGFGLTEPAAGSDAGGTETYAEDKGDHFIINGEKHLFGGEFGSADGFSKYIDRLLGDDAPAATETAAPAGDDAGAKGGGGLPGESGSMC